MKKWTVVLAVIAMGAASVYAGEATEKKTADKSGEKAASSVVKLTAANFEQTLKSGVVLVDFWAPWCGPCRVQGPILDEVAKMVGEGVVIGKVNVDENGEIASKYKIQSIPTLIVFKDGKIVERLTGVQQKDDLVKILEKAKKQDQ